MRKKLTKCLACGGTNLEQVLDLGKQPLANNYGETKKYPLCMNGCLTCGHGQLSIVVPPKKLFKHYLYESGTSNTLRQWFADFVKQLGEPGTILDIASNDGTFLRIARAAGWEVLGIDPAENLAPTDIPTVNDFFNEDTARFLGKYDVITAFNVVAHTPNPLSLLKGVRKALRSSGRAFVMTSQANIWRTGQFDTMYHEHYSYFTIASMTKLANRAGLVVKNVTMQNIHGGSLLFELEPNHFDKFKVKAEEVINLAKQLDGEFIAYGAAAKGVVFLNATGLKPQCVIDEATLKQDQCIPGTDVMVTSPDFLYYYPDDITIVILAWNFYDEIVAKIKKLRPNNNDRFVRFFQ